MNLVSILLTDIQNCEFQEPFINIPEDTIREALKVVLGTAINEQIITV